MDGAMSAGQYLKAGKAAAANCAKSSTAPHDPVSLVPDLRHVDSKRNVPPIPPPYQPSKELASKLVQWFSHVRQQLASCRRDPEPNVDFRTTVRSIESGEMPKTQDIRSPDDAVSIIGYFERRGRALSRTDLFWLFGALVYLDPVLAPSTCVAIQGAHDIIVGQLQGMPPDDPRVAYSSVVLTLITRYFRQ
jgi:hypothetical protein